MGKPWVGKVVEKVYDKLLEKAGMERKKNSNTWTYKDDRKKNRKRLDEKGEVDRWAGFE